jgi:hypothetical protein
MSWVFASAPVRPIDASFIAPSDLSWFLRHKARGIGSPSPGNILSSTRNVSGKLLKSNASYSTTAIMTV